MHSSLQQHRMHIACTLPALAVGPPVRQPACANLRCPDCCRPTHAAGPQSNATTNGTQQSSTAAAPSTLGSFKAASAAPNQVVFPTAVLYIKDTAAGGSSSASSLSGGAVAGITVGAVAGAAALTAAAWLLLQRAQRRRQQAQQKDCEDATASAAAAGCAGSCTRSTGCASSASSVHCSTAGRATSPPLSGVGTLSTSGDALPELVAHVAAHDAAQVSHRPSSPESSSFMEWEESMLPPHLREWVVDSSQVHYLRRADGKLWDLGSGASGKVYRVEYRGEVRAAGPDGKQQHQEQQQQQQQQQRNGLVALLGAWRCRHLAWWSAHSLPYMGLPLLDCVLCFPFSRQLQLLAAKEVELGANQSLRETFVTEARMLHQVSAQHAVVALGLLRLLFGAALVLRMLSNSCDSSSAFEAIRLPHGLP